MVPVCMGALSKARGCGQGRIKAPEADDF